MNNSFKENNIEEDDHVLIAKALAGTKVALAMTSVPDEAADLTQEVLIKVITKLGSFNQKSSFRTWMYRIVKNHFLNMKKGKYERKPISFHEFGEGIDSIANQSLANFSFEVENKLLVEEAKLSCMKAMLLCLDREQRLIYILGEVFEFTDTVGSQVMEITKANFRVKLHRAKQQLYNFMDNKCGLVNKNNPCRCAKKTAGFIKEGFVDPQSLSFQKDRITTIDKVAKQNVGTYENEVINEYQQLYQAHPFLQSPDSLQSIKKLLSSESIKKTFNLQ